MKLSWSQKLFLKINKTVGKRPWLDKIMYFCGQWLIFFLLCFTGFSLLYTIIQHHDWYLLAVATTAFVITISMSYFTALLFSHPRPIKELPHVKELIIPIENWKSFPSDHTIAATLCTIFIFFVFDETSLEQITFAVSSFAAVLVMFGRIYCGVHYPRDILGGILFAFLGSIAAIFLCSVYFFGF